MKTETIDLMDRVIKQTRYRLGLFTGHRLPVKGRISGNEEPDSLVDLCYQNVDLCEKFKSVKLTKEISSLLDNVFSRYANQILEMEYRDFGNLSESLWKELASVERAYYYQKRGIPPILSDL